MKSGIRSIGLSASNLPLEAFDHAMGLVVLAMDLAAAGHTGSHGDWGSGEQCILRWHDYVLGRRIIRPAVRTKVTIRGLRDLW